MNILQILFLDIFKKTALCVYGKYLNAEISPKSVYILVNTTMEFFLSTVYTIWDGGMGYA
jgi:hypothetical protein